MKLHKNNRLANMVAAFMLAFLSGCVSSSPRESIGGYINDPVITAKIRGAMSGEPALRTSEIGVETFRGVAQLSGFVATRHEISKAVLLAQSVDGVVSVHNDIRLR